MREEVDDNHEKQGVDQGEGEEVMKTVISEENNETRLSPAQSTSKLNNDKSENPNPESGGNEADARSEGEENSQDSSKSVRLFKSSRLKGYLTLVLASVINFDAAQKSEDVIKASGAIPATPEQRSYALSAAIVSLILTGATTLVHLDSITPLQKIWVVAFKPKSRFELLLTVFLVIWWSVATGIQTSINGIAGDGYV